MSIIRLDCHKWAKELWRDMTNKEKKNLEDSIVKERCLRRPILLFGNGKEILSGQNRYEICKKHGIEPWIAKIIVKDGNIDMKYIEISGAKINIKTSFSEAVVRDTITDLNKIWGFYRAKKITLSERR